MTTVESASTSATPTPIRVFVGCAPNGEDAESCLVLEHTIRKHATLPVEITWMRMSRDPKSPWYVGPGGWNTSKWATPFSGFRWLIPEVCNYQGRAIYMDSDMIVLRDLKELFEMPMNGRVAAVKRPDRFCVTLWDCARFEELIDEGQLIDVGKYRANPTTHQYMMQLFQIRRHLIAQFDRQWNNFDGENDTIDTIKILHYTDMSTQPHARYAVPRLLGAGRKHWFDGEFRDHRRPDIVLLFDEMYREALASGRKVEDYVWTDAYGDFTKESQKHYISNNGFDVTQGQ